MHSNCGSKSPIPVTFSSLILYPLPLCRFCRQRRSPDGRSIILRLLDTDQAAAARLSRKPAPATPPSGPCNLFSVYEGTTSSRCYTTSSGSYAAATSSVYYAATTPVSPIAAASSSVYYAATTPLSPFAAVTSSGLYAATVLQAHYATLPPSGSPHCSEP